MLLIKLIANYTKINHTNIGIFKEKYIYIKCIDVKVCNLNKVNAEIMMQISWMQFSLTLL